MSSTNLDELKALVSAIKEDHQEQKEKERREAWTRYVSLSTICLAVLAAIASQESGGYTTATIRQLNEATFNQAEASGQWSYYESKEIKQIIHEMERERLKRHEVAGAGELAGLSAKIADSDAEKNSIREQAKMFERKRNEARDLAAKASALSGRMGLATTIFQVAIALGGVCLIVKKRWLWACSLLLGALATVEMAVVLLTP
ncbi:MAG: DUF4337 family protein [Opitutaceae bacterium]|jgi:hypothetical protein